MPTHPFNFTVTPFVTVSTPYFYTTLDCVLLSFATVTSIGCLRVLRVPIKWGVARVVQVSQFNVRHISATGHPHFCAQRDQTFQRLRSETSICPSQFLSESYNSPSSESRRDSTELCKMTSRQAACEPCRKSKLACDRERPVCARCRQHRRQDSCIYRAAPFKRKQPAAATSPHGNTAAYVTSFI